jgi:flagellar basal-body rod protein FlgB
MFDLVSANPMIQTMDRTMSLATRRMGLIAANLANIDTPGYRNQMPISQTHPKHFALDSASSLPAPADPAKPNYERNDGNDVSLDRENAALARTQLTYQFSSTFAQMELKKIFKLISDGVAH